MKKILFGALLFPLAFSTLSFAQEGIKFVSGSWKEVLAMAQSERKLIFVDAFTTWCGPCKMMDRNTYSDAGIGLYFNENFINYKLDMERGEGLTLARKYKVNAYPTLLFINHEGTEIHREQGYKGPMQLMRIGQLANDPQKNGALLELEFEQGDQEPGRIKSYAFLLKETDHDYRKAAKRYFETVEEKDLLDPANWEAVQAFTFDVDSREFQYLVKRKRRFQRKFGEDAVDAKIQDVLKKHTIAAALTGNDPAFQQALSLADDAFKDRGQYADRLRMAYEAANKDWVSYAPHAVHYFGSYSIRDAAELERAAHNFYVHVKEIPYLQKAVRWAQQAQALAPSFDLEYLEAGLYFRSGNIPDALRAAYQCLATAKTMDDGESQISMATQLVEDIEAENVGGS